MINQLKTILQDKEIINSWENRNHTKLWFSYKENNEKKIVEINNPEWYFCVDRRQFLNKRGVFNELIQKGLVDRVEDSLFPKIYTKCLQDTNRGSNRFLYNKINRELKDNGILKTYEMDFSLVKRYSHDLDLKIASEYDILYFDIETDDTVPVIEIGSSEILTFAGIDNKGNEFKVSGKEIGEIELLRRLVKLANKYDVLTGWNIDGFDIPYIKARIDKYLKQDQIIEQLDDKKIICVDLLPRIRKVLQYDSDITRFDLNFISKHFLGRGKLDFDGRVIDLFENDEKKLLEYNLEDCKLVKDIDEDLGLLDLMIKECQWCKTFLGEFYISNLLDNYIIDYSHKRRRRIPTKRNYPKKIKLDEIKVPKLIKNEKGKVIGEESVTKDIIFEYPYAGGFVLEPEKGYFKNVYIFDFTSLYPSIILTSQIGFETLSLKSNDSFIRNPGTHNLERIQYVNELPIIEKYIPRKIRTATPLPSYKTGIIKTYFDKNTESSIASVIKDLLDRRKEYKKKKKELKEGTHEYKVNADNEVVVKELANSVYGVMGLRNSRYYDINLAESITLTGQYLIQWTIKWFEDQGYQVLFSDTDSVGIYDKGKEINVEKVLEKYHKNLTIHLKEYNINEHWIDLKYEKCFSQLVIVAKKAYIGVVDNDIQIKGLELKKRNTIEFTKKVYTELVDLVFEEKKTSEIINFIKKVREQVLNDDIKPEEITISNRISKKISEYKTESLIVDIAKKRFRRTGYQDTNEISFIVTGSSPKLKGVELEEFRGEFDREYYWNVRIYSILERFLSVVFPKIDWSEYYI